MGLGRCASHPAARARSLSSVSRYYNTQPELVRVVFASVCNTWCEYSHRFTIPAFHECKVVLI